MPLTAKMTTEVHLGDGIFAAYDGRLVTVRLAEQSGDRHLCLEPAVLRILLLGAVEIGRRNEAEAKATAAMAGPPR